MTTREQPAADPVLDNLKRLELQWKHITPEDYEIIKAARELIEQQRLELSTLRCQIEYYEADGQSDE